jgi:hypothetical protein
MLQSKAGYIDARPHIRQLDQSSLATHGRTIQMGHSRQKDTSPAVTGCPLRAESGQVGGHLAKSA